MTDERHSAPKVAEHDACVKLLSQVAPLFGTTLVCKQQMRDAAGADMHCRHYALSTNSGDLLAADQWGFVPCVAIYNELPAAAGPLSVVVLGQPARAVRGAAAAAAAAQQGGTPCTMRWCAAASAHPSC